MRKRRALALIDDAVSVYSRLENEEIQGRAIFVPD